MLRSEILTAIHYMRQPAAFVTNGPEGWTLHFLDEADESERVLDLHAARGNLRTFSTLDTAARTAKEMGAWKLTITL